MSTIVAATSEEHLVFLESEEGSNNNSECRDQLLKLAAAGATAERQEGDAYSSSVPGLSSGTVDLHQMAITEDHLVEQSNTAAFSFSLDTEITSVEASSSTPSLIQSSHESTTARLLKRQRSNSRSNNSQQRIFMSSSSCTATAPQNQEPWRDVNRNIAKMDQLYDASFSTWIRNESHLSITANHIKRIYRDYSVEQVVNGLVWLVSEWTLGSITRFLDALIITDLFKNSDGNSDVDQNFMKTTSSSSEKSSTKPSVLCYDGDSSLLMSDDFVKGVNVIAALISPWTLNFTSEILLSFFKCMPSIKEKKQFMSVFLRHKEGDWGFSRVNELFLHMGARVDWEIKIHALKIISGAGPTASAVGTAATPLAKKRV
jgi:hypothetical protein